MQTFLPYPSFRESVACLDRQRLGKQRVEAKQILLALGVPVGDHLAMSSSWANHPACRMWRRHETALAEYAMAACQEWIRRGYKDSLLAQFFAAWKHSIYDARFSMDKPAWLGNEALHRSHRSNLLRKDHGYYSRFGWTEPDNLPYFWPA